MKFLSVATVCILIIATPVTAQSVSTGRADDNYGSNAGAGNNASSASTDQSATVAGQKKKRSAVARQAANQPPPGNSAAETAGAATPNDTSRRETRPTPHR